jgi:hypothetical protein
LPAEPLHGGLKTWSLLHRQDDDRAGVHGVVASLLAVAHSHDWLTLTAQRWWIPADDPHRGVLDSGAGLR